MLLHRPPTDPKALVWAVFGLVRFYPTHCSSSIQGESDGGDRVVAGGFSDGHGERAAAVVGDLRDVTVEAGAAGVGSPYPKGRSMMGMTQEQVTQVEGVQAQAAQVDAVEAAAGLRIYEAVGLAMVRKAARLAQMHGELAELQWLPFIQPHELLLLEDHGFLLDFETGLCIDTWPALPVEGGEEAAG